MFTDFHFQSFSVADDEDVVIKNSLCVTIIIKKLKKSEK